MAAARQFILLALAAAISAVPIQAHAARDLASVLGEINQGFICPEFQPDDAARHAEVVAFSRALASVGPTRISYRQAAYIRAKMLDRHNCGRGGATVANADMAGHAEVSGVAN